MIAKAASLKALGQLGFVIWLVGALAVPLGCGSAPRVPGQARPRVEVQGRDRQPTRNAAAHSIESSSVIATSPMLPVTAADPTLGPTEAPVTIVMFLDLECPFSSRVQSSLERVRDEYGDQVRLVFKHNPLPFHPGAFPAALASVAVFESAGADAFFRFYRQVLQHQWELRHSHSEREAKEALFRALGRKQGKHESGGRGA